MVLYYTEALKRRSGALIHRIPCALSVAISTSALLLRRCGYTAVFMRSLQFWTWTCWTWQWSVCVLISALCNVWIMQLRLQKRRKAAIVQSIRCCSVVVRCACDLCLRLGPCTDRQWRVRQESRVWRSQYSGAMHGSCSEIVPARPALSVKVSAQSAASCPITIGRRRIAKVDLQIIVKGSTMPKN